MSYPIIRMTTNTGVVHDNRQKFMQIQQSSKCIAQVLQHATSEVAAAKFPVGRYAESEWAGFPWLTLVFGSGSLQLPDGVAARADAFADRVGTLLAGCEAIAAYDEEAQGHDQTLRTRIAIFTRALCWDRLAGVADPPRRPLERHLKQIHEESEITSMEPITAYVVALTTTLTELYYLLKSKRSMPFKHASESVAAAIKNTSAANAGNRLRDAAQELIDNIQDMLDDRRDTGRREVAPAAVEQVIAAVKEGLNGGAVVGPQGHSPNYAMRVRASDLRSLTEIAWCLLIQNSPIYPGWSELLVQLAVRDSGPSPRSYIRPQFQTLSEIPDNVNELFETPTARSWQRSRAASRETTERTTLYDAAGDLLWAQAAACAAERARRQDDPPVTVAFVASFDLEVEMALWRRAPTSAGSVFHVVVPVHVRRDNNQRDAELCWLLGDVTVERAGDDAADLVALSTPTNWRMVHPGFDMATIDRHPIVVHLAGCSLINLPTHYDEQLKDSAMSVGIDLDRTPRLDAAVTVDEYLALRQSETELMWHGDSNKMSSEARLSRNLPNNLLGGSRACPRYWMSLGVPVADVAVRHRLLSQLTRHRLITEMSARGGEVAGDHEAHTDLLGSFLGADSRELDDASAGSLLGDGPGSSNGAGDGGAARDTVASDVAGLAVAVRGVAVNARIGPDEMGLLYWSGLDVINGADCHEFAADLEHYAAHVRAHQPSVKKPSLEETCHL